MNEKTIAIIPVYSIRKHLFGYIEINVSKRDIIFEIYRSMGSGANEFIVHSPVNGNHFPILQKNNKQLKEEIQSFLKTIEKEHLQETPNIHIDYSVYENFMPYFDIRSFIDTEIS